MEFKIYKSERMRLFNAFKEIMNSKQLLINKCENWRNRLLIVFKNIASGWLTAVDDILSSTTDQESS